MFSDDIVEGFLCPICHSDEKNEEALLKHFYEQHSEDKNLISTFAGAFKKFLNLDENDLSKTFENTLKTSKSLLSSSNNPFQDFEYIDVKQDIGKSVDYFPFFKDIRNPRIERYATETNKLMIRLDKLLTNRPADSQQIKQHEQNLIPWIDGKLVKLCPSCAKTFHIARRQHHCRLCGSVMCNECSHFLTIDESMSIINPTHEATKQNDTNTDIILKEPEDSIRLCEHCLHLLEIRREMQDSRLSKPIITDLYERIEKIKKMVQPDIIMYEKMIISLYRGDSIYTIADAGALRGKIGAFAEAMDDLSKKTLTLKCGKGSQQEALQKSIRMGSIKFIKENMLTLPQIPVEEEIKRIQQERIVELNQKIERDRRLAQEAFEKYDLSGNSGFPAATTSTSSKPQTMIKSVDYWSGYQPQQQQQLKGKEIDPFIEQINNIQHLIKQAREDMRFDELETLEANLKELRHELYLQNQEHN